MRQINLFQAKTHFSALIQEVITKHEEFIVARRGEVVAKIVPVEDKKRDVRQVVKDLQAFGEEMKGRKMTLSEIMRMKEEGRR